MDVLLVLAARMVSESPRYSKHGFAVHKAVELINRLVELGGLFVATDGDTIVGFFAGVVSEHFLSHDKCASDIGIYVLPEYRGTTAFPRLIYAFETWAQEQGANELVLGVSTGVHPELTVRMYERMGYTMASYGLIKAGV